MPPGPNRVYLPTVLLILVGLHKTGSSTSSPGHPVCKPGLEFWSSKRGTCWPCTKCAPEFTLTPCAIYKDAICGPFSALEIYLAFLESRKQPETGQHRPEVITSNMPRRFPDLDPQQVRKQPGDLINLEKSLEVDTARQRTGESLARKSSSAERILWDWQTAALILAVCACILFFLVAGCSALVYTRQWRRMKKNFEAVGLEEISARLNLLVKAELAELVASTPVHAADPERRCQYLEKLLDRKREAPVMVSWPEVSGNLYIEEGQPRKGKTLQIARIHRNIETMLSQKKNPGEQ
ncbi:tumor necrosis factor receptor superfamily member wengen [Halictus rubicundus]|uniref:tumor necrosis factor receptor superfamily member wengen n=1 Tax=Halictus rubicundus TaxID=77578 RepID=UPI00403622B2